MISHDLIINSLEETILLFDRKARIIFVNKSGEELFGKSARDILGKKFSQLANSKESITPLIRKTITEGRTFRGKSVALDIGYPLDIDFNLSPFYTGGKVPGVLLSISQNITDKQDFDFETIDYLLGSIAHEIKNPLGGIKGAAQLLRNNTQDACIDEYVELIIRETDRLNSILLDYLNVWKKPSFGPVNIHEVVEQAISIMKMPVQKAKIRIKRLYDPSLPPVKGDDGKLLQVFLNITKNAVESMEKGGKLEVSTYPSKVLFGKRGKSRRMALITVRDTGKGISEKDIGKIFIPFYTKKKQGSGIGLAVSQKIIKDHAGFIKVKSQKNKGTSFYIYIPFWDNAQKNTGN